MKTTLRKLTVAWPLVTMLLLPSLTRAEVAVQAWVQRYTGPTESDDHANNVTRDAADNVIVAGYTDDGVHGRDMLVIKYSVAGFPLWTNRYNGADNRNDEATAVATDGARNVCLTG